LFLFLFLAFGMVSGCKKKQEEAPPVPVASVRCGLMESRSWADIRTLRGTVAAQPDRDAIVSPQVAGRLLRVRVREGDTVHEGDVIANVESRPVKNALRQAKALLIQARAQHEAAAAAAVREKHLYERGISARQTYEAARANQGQADGAVALARAQIDIARQNVERATVRAPISGIVIRLLRREGELVDGTPATPVMEIADPSTLELAASARANDLVVLQLGQKATVKLEPLPERVFSATICAVSPAVDTATGVGSVRLRLVTEGMRLPIGILGTAEVKLGATRKVDAVPASAIRNAGGARSEIVSCSQGKAHPLPVVIGERRDGWVQIVSGLETVPRPIRVVTDGLTGLEDGMTIKELP
jgi:RND family efflux transporter MFP subunit